MRALLLLSLCVLPSCFLRDTSEFQGSWFADYAETDGTTVRIRLDFSLIVDDAFTTHALVRVQEPLSTGASRPVSGAAFGSVKGDTMMVTIPVTLLDGSQSDLQVSGPRYAVEDDGFPVELAWRGVSTSTQLTRPIGDRWDIDTAVPEFAVDTGPAGR